MAVDHTTDVHRGKLALYESWGFPEVWVEVPEAPSRGRRKANDQRDTRPEQQTTQQVAPKWSVPGR